MGEEGRPQEVASRGILGSPPEVRPGQTDPSLLAKRLPWAFSLGLEKAPCAEAGAVLFAFQCAVGSTERQENASLHWPSGVQLAELQGSEAQISPAPLGCKGAGINRSGDFYFDNLSEIN